MKLLALPGRKPSTLEPTRRLLAALGLDEGAIRPHGFWSAPDVTDPDIAGDVEAVAASGADLVIAKSIGALIVMAAWRDHGFAPRACLFLGTPLKRLEALGLVPLLQAFAVATPTLFIQQAADFNGAYADLARWVGSAARTAEIPGDDHRYEDIDVILPFAAAWLDPWREGLA